MPDFVLALLGSGEFEPWTETVDRWLLERASGDGRILLLPTASAPEGDEVFEYWSQLGLAHYGDLGLPASVLPLKTREEAGAAEMSEALRGASMVFFSGGNPAYLAQVLEDTPFWAALLEEIGRGMAYSGCSAGVASLGQTAPDSSAVRLGAEMLGRPGLGLFPGISFAPHWDALNSFVPGLREFILESVPAGERLLAIDERTAVVGDGERWTVMGSGGAYLIAGGTERAFAAGASFDEPLIAVGR
jgi:cyanophycinase